MTAVEMVKVSVFANSQLVGVGGKEMEIHRTGIPFG